MGKTESKTLVIELAAIFKLTGLNSFFYQSGIARSS